MRQLTGVLGEILALPDEDAALLNNATAIKRAMYEVDFEIGRWFYQLEDTPKVSEAHEESTVELPKISVATFDDVLNWALFWEQFETTIHNNKKLHNAQK